MVKFAFFSFVVGVAQDRVLCSNSNSIFCLISHIDSFLLFEDSFFPFVGFPGEIAFCLIFTKNFSVVLFLVTFFYIILSLACLYFAFLFVNSCGDY